MLKSMTGPVAAAALAAGVLVLMAPRGERAAAQTAPAAPAAPASKPAPVPLYVSTVDLEIAPASMSGFLAALRPDAAAMIQEPGAREFDSAVEQKDPGHVFIFEGYSDEAAYTAHQKTGAYTKFLALTMMMIKKYDIRAFTTAATNRNTAAPPAPGPFLVNRVELDIVPAQFDQFMTAAKANAAASMQDAGCREFDIAVAAKDPHHVLFLEIYDNAAALSAHEATDHYKAYMATTKDMVAKRDTSALSSVQLLTKAQ